MGGSLASWIALAIAAMLTILAGGISAPSGTLTAALSAKPVTPGKAMPEMQS